MKRDRTVASGSTIEGGGAMLISPSRVPKTGSGTLLAGCAATSKISLDPQVRKRLGEMGEIRAVHYNTCPDCAGRPEGLPVVTKADPNMARPAGYLPIEAPVKAVKDRFLAAVSTELGLTNLKTIDQPRHTRVWALMAPLIDPLKSEFGGGLVFDFYSPVWTLNRTYQPPWERLVSTPRYAFLTYVRARLIRLDDSSILWQQMCGAGAKQGRTLEEWASNNYALLHAELEPAARSCADGLV